VREAARGSRREPDLPAGLRSRVTAALDAEDRSASRARRFRRLLPALLAAAAILALLLLVPRAPDFVRAARTDFRRYESAALTLELPTANPAELQRFFDARAGTVRARVFDFGMMGYRLAGGRTYRLGGRDAVLFAYRSESGNDVLCVMFAGRLAELPSGGEERVHGQIRFQVYRKDGVTLVFWQEGDTVCVLMSGGPPEETFQLAYAKAVAT
jgi:hypothetical protein